MSLRIARGFLLTTFSLSLAASGQQEPAGEGRVITPAGTLVMDAATQFPAVGAMPMTMLRSPDTLGHGGKGRYLLVVNSGYGVQFSEETNHAQQSIAVIDLNANPAPAVIQNVYFPTPQSANVGLVFAPTPAADGSFSMFVSGGFENKIWIFRFDPRGAAPIQPPSPGPETKIAAPFIQISNSGEASPKDYNKGKATLYPTGLAVTGTTLVTANNLGDSVTIVRDLNAKRRMQRLDLHHPGKLAENIYPYGVVAMGTGKRARAYVSCWNDSSVAVISLNGKPSVLKSISVGWHPTAMLLNAQGTRLFVANSNADSVSVIDTRLDQEIERIDVRLAENALPGSSPEGVAVSEDEKTLYVANAHSNAVAVVALSEKSRGAKNGASRGNEGPSNSKILGFIPTGQYPSALAVADGKLFIGNGKGTGFELSSMRVNNSGRTPNPPTAAFPPNPKKNRQGGQYSGSIVSGNIIMVELPDEPALARHTQQTLQNDGLMDFAPPSLFPGTSPIKHVVYIIKENRTYDQVFGDVKMSGDNHVADGEPNFAIFGAGEAARRPDGTPQIVTPNHRALALRFGLFDRFFVNSEASPDGHNWSTAAFSTDYVDKGFRWQYSDRGRTYDWEGYNRLPDYEPPGNLDLGKFKGDALAALTDMLQKHLPYRQGFTDLAEPKTLYLWDAAARAGLTYRSYGEFGIVISTNDVEAVAQKRRKTYPDISKAVRAIASKPSLENHLSPSFRSFDVSAPDSTTEECYKAALNPSGSADAAVTRWNANPDCNGNSRLGEWLGEFRGFVAQREAGKPDPMPALSIVRLPNDHTTGMSKGFPTPQFMVADNDYAVGRLVEAISSSVYWKDTAIFMVEDDAQSGPDHVDSHRSVALVVSAYNKPGALIHKFHNTVSMIRTIEMLLGIAPMNQLDASAVPMDIFQQTPDLTPYKAVLPTIALNNLLTERPKDKAAAEWMKKSLQQNFAHADMAEPKTLNAIIWFACKGNGSALPESAKLPAYQAMRLGIVDPDDSAAHRPKPDDD